MIKQNEISMYDACQCFRIHGSPSAKHALFEEQKLSVISWETETLWWSNVVTPCMSMEVAEGRAKRWHPQVRVLCCRGEGTELVVGGRWGTVEIAGDIRVRGGGVAATVEEEEAEAKLRKHMWGRWSRLRGG
jgi:hypothetical protein